MPVVPIYLTSWNSHKHIYILRFINFSNIISLYTLFDIDYLCIFVYVFVFFNKNICMCINSCLICIIKGHFQLKHDEPEHYRKQFLIVEFISISL